LPAPVGESEVTCLLKVLLVVVLLAAGCGSGSSGKGGGGEGGAGSCTASLTPGASMSWDENGGFQCAADVSATGLSSATLNLLNLVGSQTSGEGLAFGVTTPGTPIDGAYSCGASTTDTVTFNYQQGQTPTFASTCSITVTSSGEDGGTRATGTFSGVFDTPSGTRTLTNGAFDAPVTIVAE
jgi:hypothetical protein